MWRKGAAHRQALLGIKLLTLQNEEQRTLIKTSHKEKQKRDASLQGKRDNTYGKLLDVSNHYTLLGYMLTGLSKYLAFHSGSLLSCTALLTGDTAAASAHFLFVNMEQFWIAVCTPNTFSSC